jgi:hypothetical protein
MPLPVLVPMKTSFPSAKALKPPLIVVIASQSESFCYTYVGELKMAAPSEEKLICDKFNLEALTVNQVKSFKALTDLEDGNLYLRLRTMLHTIYAAQFEQTIIHQHVLL